MHAALITIYLLAVGTLLAGAGMTLWERKARPARGAVLATWSSGYVALALGCLVASARDHLPGISGAAISNLIILTGYLLILHGAAALNGRQYRVASFALLMVIAAFWWLGGSRWQETIWLYASALPIAAICGATAWEVKRCEMLRHLPSRNIVMGVIGIYAGFYAARALILPVMATLFGPSVVTMASTLTMYMGVLYSVVLPMALLAMIREEAHARLLELAMTDYLTGLGNRTWFFEQGARLIGASPRALSLLAFDMDHFKSINDRHGHATGDDVLKTFAQVLRSATKSDAILARIGGEEFAAILPGSDSDQARQIGQTVMQRFAETAVLSRGGIAVRTTVSVGLAELAAQKTDLASLLNAADRALYMAKTSGRNRIELAEPSLLPLKNARDVSASGGGNLARIA